ncbi:uncharacterized protein [Lolium perenne]|uniref:uncharacterized protein isoform X1 n=1 Tax=Lolium perenne TaxID=4522 RepID=UPI0021F61C19|nr:uncharacterized protein LOC127296222 isoform X1 [Lolium perenne]
MGPSRWALLTEAGAEQPCGHIFDESCCLRALSSSRPPPLKQTGSSPACLPSDAPALMALLLLRHTLTITSSDDEDDASAIFSLFLLWAAGFLLPCYIMAWDISIMQRQRQRQEEAMLLPTEVTIILHPNGTMQFTVSPEIPASPHLEPAQ